MSEITNHIIAKVSWNTSFDWKEKGIELQDRLSAWSKIKMPRNIIEIFDKFCPSEQTWEIEALELDLGKIDFNNLEAELSQQISAQLNQKLIDLVINGNRDRLKINIQDHAVSQLHLLQHFLLYGVMPWSYHVSDGSIQQLFAEQLRNNRSKVTDLLRELGTAHLEVRKRLAWQVDDENIKSIIKSLEPNNHDQIFDFSKEMIRIKTKENRIQGSNIDFKKNLWLWVFNYLLTERGTIFNKIAFMKSNIKQMASHYNVSYQDFLTILNDAVHQITLRNLVKHEFIVIINTLVVEQKEAGKKREAKKAPQLNEWNVLRNYFLTSEATSKQSEFNDLVLGLAKVDEARFKALILSLAKDGKWINGIGSVLNNSSIEALFSTLIPVKSQEFIRRLQFLIQLNKEINLQIGQDVVWEIGLKFLHIHCNNSVDLSKFFDYYLNQLTKRSGWGKKKIAKKIIAVNISSSAKSSSNLVTYIDLIQKIEENNSIKKALSNPVLIIDLIEQLNAYPGDSESIELLKNELQKNVQLNPKLTLAKLIKYAQRVEFESSFNLLFNIESSTLLLQSAVKEKVVIFSILQKVAGQFRKEQPNFFNWLHENILQAGLNTIIFYPQLRSAKLVDFIFLKLSSGLTPIYRYHFQQFVQFFSNENHTAFRNISHILLKRKKQLIFQQIELLIATGNHKRAVGEILAVGFRTGDLSVVDLQKYPKRERLATYLLNSGNDLIQLLLKEYTQILLKQVPKTKLSSAQKLMEELLWKCLVTYKNHHGSPDRFKKLFQQAVEYRLNINYSPQENNQPFNIAVQEKKLLSLSSGQQIANEELFGLIEECFRKGLDQIAKQGFKFDFNELIKIALTVDTTAFERIWIKFSFTKKRVHLLETTISFTEFSLWMMTTGHSHANGAIKSLNNWFEVVSYLLKGEVPKDIINVFWEQLWKIGKSGNFSSSTLKKFIQETLFRIAVVKPMNTNEIIHDIQKSKIEIGSSLADAIVLCIPNFSKASANIIPKRLINPMRKDLLEQFIHHFLIHHQAPAWFIQSHTQEKELLNEIVMDYPVQFFLALKHEKLSDRELKWLNEILNFKVLIKTIGHLNKNQLAMLQMVEHFYFSLGKLKNANASAKEIQFILFKKILSSWLSGNWKVLSATRIWQELIWEVCVQKGVNQGKLIQSFSLIKLQLPPMLQVTFDQIVAQQQQLKIQEQKQILKKPDSTPFFVDDKELLKDSIFVQNAGLVLINHYIPILFERLGLVENKSFLSDKHLEAVHYLQFVATGLMQTAEPELALNKVLCGIPLNQPIKDEIFMTTDEIELIEHLITAMIGYWGAIGSSSIDGFRGNWLIRDGLLIEYEDKWELTIEKRAYDLLIHQSPFTFSIVKYPWMNKPLYVQWPH